MSTKDQAELVEWAPQKAVSKIFGIAPQTLSNQRCKGEGLPYVKVGRKVLYHLPTIRAYLQARTIDPQNGE